MRTLPRLSLALLGALSAAPLAAQLTFTSPPGAQHLEGNSSSGVLWGAAAGHQSRVQQADANFIGEHRMPVILSIAWRRDWPGTATAVARTAELTLIMAHTDYATFSSTYARNYKDMPVTVFARKTINLPAWTPITGTAPAPFDLKVPYDLPWVYNRVDALLWEGVVTNTGAAGRYSDDWFSAAAANDWSMTIQESAGCTTANGPFQKRDGYRTTASALNVGWEVRGGPSNAAVTVLLGAQLQSVAVPGLCAPLAVLPLLTLPLGTTDGAGALPLGATSLTWNPTLAGAEVAAQAAALDVTQPGLPIAVSNGTRTVLPKVLGNPGINCKRTFTQGSATATTGSSVSVTAAPTQFGF